MCILWLIRGKYVETFTTTILTLRALWLAFVGRYIGLGCIGAEPMHVWNRTGPRLLLVFSQVPQSFVVLSLLGLGIRKEGGGGIDLHMELRAEVSGVGFETVYLAPVSAPHE